MNRKNQWFVLTPTNRECYTSQADAEARAASLAIEHMGKTVLVLDVVCAFKAVPRVDVERFDATRTDDPSQIPQAPKGGW